MSDQDQQHEYKRWIYEQAGRVYERHSKFVRTLNELAIKSSELSLRTCILINGGAAISILVSWVANIDY